ncbi:MULTISPECIES: hypothetical protein [Pseudomonas]|jgi:hypothetical protein|uniref:hypothetical protein n=1 Tax=Pseudomonas TaxID=286 RepID=UPI000483E786|nr:MULTISPECIES: hypothetical protein [Pseudomonas]PRA53234.1 hypothetical protein CQZ98_14485 [Pseudomonas sp. MYb115]QXN52163.1 hypothetical protein KW062_10670 [Pseudomonas fluorescens]WSO26491.1 hypothetical protein VUJ50_10725 [Pseudomonas fluorescens]
MNSVSIEAAIKVNWPQGHSSYSPGSPEELALLSIDLLVKALGAEAAHTFIAQILEKYPLGQKLAPASEQA